MSISRTHQASIPNFFFHFTILKCLGWLFSICYNKAGPFFSVMLYGRQIKKAHVRGIKTKREKNVFVVPVHKTESL